MQPLLKREWLAALSEPSPSFIVALTASAVILAIGVVGFLGVLPTALVGGRKVKWAIGLGALLTLVPAAILFIRIMQSPTGTMADGFAVIFVGLLAFGFIPVTLLVWIAMFVGDVVRHLRTRSPAA